MGKISKGLKELLACGVGIFIGGLIARAINQNFWWVGMFIGGLIAYTAFDLPQVGRAIASAWRVVSNYRLPSPKYYFKEVLWTYILILFASSWICAGDIVFTAIMEGSAQRGIQMYFEHTTEVFAFVVLFGYLGFAALLYSPHLLIVIEHDIARLSDGIKKLATAICPTLVLFWYLPKGIWYCLKRVPAGIALVARGVSAFFRLAPRFIWQVYVRIHSASRLLCGIDAAIGVGIGWIAGSVHIGLVLGLAFYAVNRYLVTEWLVRSGQLAVRS